MFISGSNGGGSGIIDLTKFKYIVYPSDATAYGSTIGAARCYNNIEPGAIILATGDYDGDGRFDNSKRRYTITNINPLTGEINNNNLFYTYSYSGLKISDWTPIPENKNRFDDNTSGFSSASTPVSAYFEVRITSSIIRIYTNLYNNTASGVSMYSTYYYAPKEN